MPNTVLSIQSLACNYVYNVKTNLFEKLGCHKISDKLLVKLESRIRSLHRKVKVWSHHPNTFFIPTAPIKFFRPARADIHNLAIVGHKHGRSAKRE